MNARTLDGRATRNRCTRAHIRHARRGGPRTHPHQPHSISGLTISAVRVFNPVLWLVISGALALLVALVASPGRRDLFRFGDLHADDLAVVIVASALALLCLARLRLVGEGFSSAEDRYRRALIGRRPP